MGDPHEFPDEHLAQLGAALGFTPGDLVANRRGQLTARQARNLIGDQRRSYWPSLVAWSILGAIVSVLVLMASGFAAEWAIVGLIVIGLGLVTAYDLRILYRKIEGEGPGVAHVTVRIDERWQPRRAWGRIEFEAMGRWFVAPSTLRDVLRSGQAYRFYYALDVPSSTLGMVGKRRSSVINCYRVLSLEPARKSML